MKGVCVFPKGCGINEEAELVGWEGKDSPVETGYAENSCRLDGTLG
jgi:hypothetical protein